MQASSIEAELGEPAIGAAPLATPSLPPNSSSVSASLAALIELTKPRITLMIVLSTLAGFVLGTLGQLDYGLLCHTALSIAILTSGTAALNQYWERNLDALMPRTQVRPLPAGKLTPPVALAFGITLVVLSEFYLWYKVNPLTAWGGFAAFATYLFLYTPLKTRTVWCTFIGAFPGALPPLLGWTAVRNQLSIEPIILFAILFLWQFPHFHAIAALYREDYAKAGIKMLPVVSGGNQATARQIIGYTVALVPVSLLPVFYGLAGPIYFGGALLLGIYFLRVSLRTAHALTRENSLALLKASVLYLPLLWALLVLQR